MQEAKDRLLALESELTSRFGEDHFQTVAVACLERRDFDWSNLDGSSRLIRRISKRKRVDQWRRLERRRCDQITGELAVDDESQRQIVIRDLCNAILSGLSPSDRCLARSRMDSKTWRETAAELECSEEVLRQRWTRLRKRIRLDFQTDPDKCCPT